QFQGTVLRDAGEPIVNLANPPGVTPGRQRLTIDAINRLNLRRLEATGDDEIRARIASYEMAFRMQARAPELLSLGGETRETLGLYGIDDPTKPSFARNCLLARRLVEKGVRFVQVFHGDW
ncbi:MAG TPA: sulfatase, partial [Planctomycetaceae bacterium]|nr:sulfatase [Planctomycetaceae bacterium]